MKLLLLSDSHGRLGDLLTAVEREEPDAVFHLGDVSEDAEDLAAAYPDIPVTAVAGNCDGWANSAPGEVEITVEGVRFFLTHGHHYRVKLGPERLMEEAYARGVDAVCYGHTHVPEAVREPDGVWRINPGTIGGIGGRATYGVVEILNGDMSVEIRAL